MVLQVGSSVLRFLYLVRPVYTLNTERVYLYTGKNLKKTLRLDQFLRQVTYLIYTELMDREE